MRSLIPSMRLVVDEMKDPEGVPPGSQGTFEGLDGVGDLLIRWDNGSSLKLIPTVDKYHIIGSDEEIETSIAHLREEQNQIDLDKEFTCPRCGKKTIKRTAALSRIADISVCSGCGTIEAILAARTGGLEINITDANADTERDFKRAEVRDWKMVRDWQGLDDIE